MRNPNGYGTVAKLSGNRRRPYIIKKTAGWKNNGQPIFVIVGYAATREEGNILLAEYNRLKQMVADGGILEVEA